MKAGGCNQVNEYMNHNVCQGLRSLNDIDPRSTRLIITSFPSKPLGRLKIYFVHRIDPLNFDKMVSVT